MSELLTVAEAAKSLACSQRTIYSLCNARKLRHARIGMGRGLLRVPADAIAEYLSGVIREPVSSAPVPAPSPRPRSQGFAKLAGLKLRG